MRRSSLCRNSRWHRPPVQATARCAKCAETLPGRALEFEMDGARGQTFGAIPLGDFIGQQGARGAVGVFIELGLSGISFFHGGSGFWIANSDQSNPPESPWSWFSVQKRRHGVAGTGPEKDGGKVERLVFPMLYARPRNKAIGLADHLVYGPEPQIRHDFTEFAGQKMEKMDHVVGRAVETLAQVGVLGRNADGTSIQVAFPHQHTALHHQRRGGHAPFLRAEQSGDRDVAPGFQLSVRLYRDAAAEAVAHERLLGFGEAQFPGQPRVFDAADGRSARAAVVAGDQDHIRLWLLPRLRQWCPRPLSTPVSR